MKPLLAAAILTAWAGPAFGQGCSMPNCSEALQQPPSPLLGVCLEQRQELADLVRQQDIMIERLEAERDDLRDKLAQAQKPKPASRKGCKPGRTRNAAGRCGRW